MKGKQSESGTKSNDERLQDMIGAVVDKAFEVAKVMTKAGIKGAFMAKDLSDKVESGEAEQAIKHGAAEAEKILKAATRVAKRHFFAFMKELVPDEDGSDDKKQA